MSHPALLQLKMVQDQDYVGSFQDLARVQVELHSRGASPERLLRAAILEMEVGNFALAREMAQKCLKLDPGNSEAHYQRGLANVLIACVKAGAIAPGPAHDEHTGMTIRSLLREALSDLQEVLRWHVEDAEAKDGVELLEAFLARAATEAELASGLRHLMES